MKKNIKFPIFFTAFSEKFLYIALEIVKFRVPKHYY